jgi:hypothetical protein
MNDSQTQIAEKYIQLRKANKLAIISDEMHELELQMDDQIVSYIEAELGSNCFC